MSEMMSEKITDPFVVSERQRGAGNIGRLLLEAGKISPEDAAKIIRQQRQSGQRFGEAAVELGFVKPEDIQYALAHQFDYPYLLPGQGNFSSELVAAYQPYSAEAETLRALRTQLLLRWYHRGRKALCFTSASEGGEGVSYQVANLAVVFSQLGEKTLLIDANLRQPRQHLIFNTGNRAGLSETLIGRAKNAICKIPAFVDLSVLPAGAIPPNPAELLARNTLGQLLGDLPDGPDPLPRSTFGQLLVELSDSYDIILIDAPTLSAYSDAQSISAVAGGAVFVVRQNHSRLARLESAKQLVVATGAILVGAVLSNF